MAGKRGAPPTAEDIKRHQRDLVTKLRDAHGYTNIELAARLRTEYGIPITGGTLGARLSESPGKNRPDFEMYEIYALAHVFTDAGVTYRDFFEPGRIQVMIIRDDAGGNPTNAPYSGKSATVREDPLPIGRAA